MICISILYFGHIANKFNDILSILKEVIIFPEKGDLFRIGKTNINPRPTGKISLWAISSPHSDLRNYWTDSKNSSGIWKPCKNCRGQSNFIDLGVTSDVTGQVKVKMFDISGLVTSASKIAMLSTNKAN